MPRHVRAWGRGRTVGVQNNSCAAVEGATMLSILVCHSYYLRLDQKQVQRAKPYPPLATLQVVSMLRNAGHRVSFFDAMLADGVEEYDRSLRASQPQLVLFYEDNF